MKIVFLSGLYPPYTKGGGEISTYLIAEGLKARGHEVKVITEENSHLGLLKKPLFEKRQSRKIAKKLKKVLLEADIVHAHDFRSALALSEVEGLAGVKVATVRDYAPICGTTHNILADGSQCHCTLPDVVKTTRFQEVGFPRNYARVWQYWHNTPYRKQAFSKIKYQIFISYAQQREIEENLDLAGVQKTVIYNPVSDEYLNTPIHEGRKGNVLYVGRVEAYKGVGLLLRAWKSVAKRVPYAHLTIVGEGAQRAKYEQWVSQQGLQYRVTFAGRAPYERLREMYDGAQIVVAPHIWTEPFGRNVAEAMARGKIVVTTNTGGPGEIIQDGQTGILFAKGSVEQLSATLQKALTFRPYDFKEIGQAAHAWPKQHLSTQKITRQHEEFYASMLPKT